MTNPALDRLRESLRTPEGQKAALEWLGMPFTQDMLAAGRELARPRRPLAPVPDQVAIALQLGETIGANDMLDFLSQPHTASVVKRQSGAGMPVPDYGARDILKKETIV